MALAFEYESPFRRFMARCIHELAQAQDPLLQEIHSKPVDHLPDESTPEGVSHGSLHPIQITSEYSLSFQALEDTDLEAWWGDLYASSMKTAEQMVKHLFAVLNETSARSGNAIDAAGQPIGYDSIMDLLEKLDLPVNQDLEFEGEPFMIVSPESAKHFAALGPLTAEQEQRFKRIMKDKYERQNAQRRTRKLD